MLPNISKNDLVVAARKENGENKARKEKERRAVRKAVELKKSRTQTVANSKRILLNKAISVFIVMKKGIGKRIV